MVTGIAWDDPAWQALKSELDLWRAEGRVASVWWRDDDAGRIDPAVERLVALAARVRLPLAVAVVPAWLEPEVASLIRTGPSPVAVLQHGFAHTNHETELSPGEHKVRPAECGRARPAARVLAEIADGQARLRATFGPRCLPVFVPPWNRSAPAVRAALPGLGYRTLSAFGPRPTTEPIPGLFELNCHADPILWREGKRFAGAAPTLERLRRHLADRRARRADPTEPTGLLTHHRDMDPAFWAFLERLLHELSEHPGAVFQPLASLLDP